MTIDTRSVLLAILVMIFFLINYAIQADHSFLMKPIMV